MLREFMEFVALMAALIIAGSLEFLRPSSGLMAASGSLMA
jgi:hypothetical protein